jgi:RHS repeat-associated protein
MALLQFVRCSGKERDSESGLDYFLARYYSGAQGRFTSPDPKMISKQRMLDPQQWNMYEYARNNPLLFIDPDGRGTGTDDDKCWKSKRCVVRAPLKPAWGQKTGLDFDFRARAATR